MQATVNPRVENPTLADEYLGYAIKNQDGCYVATPMGWNGEVLLADNLPTLRRKIWRWWHMVQ